MEYLERTDEHSDVRITGHNTTKKNTDRFTLSWANSIQYGLTQTISSMRFEFLTAVKMLRWAS
jgi:hypothetical protein